MSKEIFIAKYLGSYAIEVKVIRAEDLSEAWTIATKGLGEPFTKVEVITVSIEGDSEEVFSASYIE